MRIPPQVGRSAEGHAQEGPGEKRESKNKVKHLCKSTTAKFDNAVQRARAQISCNIVQFKSKDYDQRTHPN